MSTFEATVKLVATYPENVEMKSFKQAFNPAHQTLIQRVGFFFSIALAALVLFLHFPFDGYSIGHYAYPDGTACVDPAKVTGYSSLLKLASCTLQVAPYTEWRTVSPIISWFGSVIHAVATLAFVLLLGGIWLWVFGTEDEG